VDHVAVLDDVVLAFGAHLADFLGADFARAADEVDEGIVSARMNPVLLNRRLGARCHVSRHFLGV
jgi:hypothetical protein